MAGAAQDTAWPLPKFGFSVTFEDGESVRFQEVVGLESTARPSEYRHGNSPIFEPIKMPGLSAVGSVTMKRGLFANGDKLRQLYNKIQMNTVERGTVVVSLLDEAGAPKMTWTLHNAWPTKITGTDLEPEGNGVAVESVEIAYESLTVAAP
jgi:phage tail-like protein